MSSWSWTRRIEGPRSDRHATARLLTQAVRREGIVDHAGAADLVGRVAPRMILSLAHYHGVAGMLYEQLRPVEGVPEPLMAALRAAYDRGVQGHLRVLWELARIQAVLAPTGVRWVVIKGPAAVEQLYANPGQRTYQDLDVLVDPAGFADVLAALQEAGSEVLDRNWTVLRRELLGEVHLRLPGGTPLDLHWNLINMNRGQMWIDSAELLERSVATKLGGVPAATLDAEDTVLHLAIHAALSGGDKLLWLKDIERASAILDPRWETVVERARRWGVTAPTGLILERTLHVVDAQIPAWVPSTLLGRRSRRVVQLVERASPWELSVGRLTAASHVVSRSISQGPLRASGWFLRRLVKRLDPREPVASSAFTPRGDDRDRQAFIQAVVDSPKRRRMAG
jgi:hypothetical protein